MLWLGTRNQERVNPVESRRSRPAANQLASYPAFHMSVLLGRVPAKNLAMPMKSLAREWLAMNHSQPYGQVSCAVPTIVHPPPQALTRLHSVCCSANTV